MGRHSKKQKAVYEDHATKKKTIWVCKHVGCNKKYSSASSRAIHSQTCEKPLGSPLKKAKNTEAGFKCHYCPKVFKIQSSVYRHQTRDCNAARILSGKLPVTKAKKKELLRFMCDVCSRVFDRKGKLERHQLRHRDNPKYECRKCSCSFSRSDHHRKHEAKCSYTVPSFAAPSNDKLIMSANSIGNMSSTGNDIMDDSTSSCIDDFNMSTSTIDNINSAPSFTAHSIHNANMSNNNNSSSNDEIVGDSTFIEDFDVSIIDKTNTSATNSMNTGSKLIEENVDEPPPVYILLDELDECFDQQCDSPIDYDQLLSKGVLAYLTSIKSNSNTLFTYLYTFLGWNICDKNVQKWLHKSLGMRKYIFMERLDTWLTPQIAKRRGRPCTDSATRQEIFDVWIDNSIVSVDRRNGRDIVKMLKKDYDKRYEGISCDLVSTEKNKRNSDVVKAPRRIATVTVRMLKEIMDIKYGKKISYGIIINLRPSFVGTPSEREKLECLCGICMNCRNLFDALMKYVSSKEMECFQSITQYFIDGKNCVVARNGYVSRNCITGDCELCNGVVHPHDYNIPPPDANAPSTPLISFYQFREVLSDKPNKKGKFTKRTARVDFKDHPSVCKEMLDKMGELYLLHRYDYTQDKFMWPLIEEACKDLDEVLLHFDYSENLKEKPKFETQNHHFSGTQHSLHCSVLQGLPSSKYTYIYHLSDVKTHDWRFASTVICDLVELYFSTSTIIRIKSDNCRTQYKYANVFGFYKQYACEIQKTIIVCYGASVHGRGLVDAMSSSGLKGPLRKEIITSDFYWSSAKDLEIKFNEMDMGDHFIYKELTSELINSWDKIDPVPLKYNTKQHMIIFHPDGKIERKVDLRDCEACIIGKLSCCIYERSGNANATVNHGDGENEGTDDNGQGDDDDEIEHDDDLDEDDNDEEVEEQRKLIRNNIWNAVAPGAVIALWTTTDAKESFYLCVVNKVLVADKKLFDAYNHYVLEGMQYFSCNYLRIKKESKKFIQ